MGKKKKSTGPRRYTKKKAVRVERLLRLPPEMDSALISFAEEDGVSITDLINMALLDYILARRQQSVHDEEQPHTNRIAHC